MAFTILDINNQKDRQIWKEVFFKIPQTQQDIHYLLEYSLLYMKESVRSCAAFYTEGDTFILYPFIIRDIYIGDNIASYSNGNVAREIRNPYGIGGPLSNVYDTKLYQNFDLKFRAWCAQEQLASEFLCPHLFTNSLDYIFQNNTYTRAKEKEIVCIDLSGNQLNLWSQCNKGHKYSINLAKRNEINVIQTTSPNQKQYEAILSIYTNTMQRQNASARWYVAKNYFSDCLQLLGNEHCSFFLAYDEDTLIAWNLMMYNAETMYYHFAGSTLEGQKKGAPALLLHKASCWAQEQGYTRLYLGGGASSAPDDSVYRFKHGFSKKSISFYTAWRILHQESYDELCTQKIAYEHSIGYQSEHPYFFPFYRR